MDGCDGLSPRFRKGQSGIPAPPVVDQPHGAGREPTTRQITGAVPAPVTDSFPARRTPTPRR